jgi:hypothetical protein
MTEEEEEAREVLRLGDQDGFEARTAGQIWVPQNGAGLRVVSTRDGWNFALEPVPEGVVF